MKRVFQHPPEAPSPTGRHYWRSLEEQQNTPEFQEFLGREFPQGADQMEGDELSRRSFMQLMGASLALAGLGTTGCRRPEAHLIPYTKAVEWVIPGEQLLYATSMPRRGGAMPLIAVTTDGRPTKLEGNPLHPATNGGTDSFAQASILDLYDPDRARGFRRGDSPSDLPKFLAWVKEQRTQLAADGGASFAYLAPISGSPSRERLRQDLLRQFPSMTWCEYDPLTDSGAAFRITPRWEQADVILALDSDFLHVEEGGLAATRGFQSKRRIEKAADNMNRLYVVEPRYTITGGMAEHRLRLPASQVGAFALALAQALVGATNDGTLRAAVSSAPAAAAEAAKMEKHAKWIAECAADLVAQRGRSLVVAGPRQPAWVQALAFAISTSLGGPVTAEPVAQRGGVSLADFVGRLQSGAVKTVVIHGGNPAYDAPADLRWAEAVAKVPNRVRFGAHEDESADKATWFAPLAHYLESWGDDRAEDGSYVAVQPMVLPLFNGVSELEMLAYLGGAEKVDGPELVRATFRTLAAGAGDEATAWNNFLRDGFLANSAPSAAPAAFTAGNVTEAIRAGFKAQAAPDDLNLEVVLPMDYSVGDGRYANNGWLQEMPDPITKLTWDNAALLSPATAKRLKITNDMVNNGYDGPMLEISVGDRKVRAAALIAPGMADNVISLALGYGRPRTGRVGAKAGFNAYALRSQAAPYFASGAKVSVLAERYVFAFTQSAHWQTMEGRATVREMPLATYREKQGFDDHGKSFVQKFWMDGHIPPPADIYTNPAYTAPHQWGMAIDLNTCTGCSACVVACMGENNIPIVGKDQVRRGRFMHWIRIDRYYSTANDADQDPEMLQQPVTCHHCESAPCETVCPVNATIHTEEGLNAMAYNRCIGTRYCANNCPYKVRRFNFFDYNQRPIDQLYWGPFAKKGMDETLKLSKNPNVTVRMRGVMEKCTFCVQRIEEAKIAQLRVARDSNDTRVPRDSFKTACQQACPSEAITFGDVADPESRVSKLKKTDRDYRMLEYLNIKPRLSYLARVRNPNPRMPGAENVGMSTLKDEHNHDDSHGDPKKPGQAPAAAGSH